MRSFLSLCRFAVLGTVVFVLSGCGPAGVKIGGNVTKGGAPFQAGADEVVRLSIISDDGKSFDGEVTAGGKFSIAGPDNSGIPAGKYKVSVTRYNNKPGAMKGPPTPVTLPDVWDVSSSNTNFTLDISKVK